MQRLFTADNGKAYRNILIGNFDCDNYWRDEGSMQLPYIDFRRIRPIIQSLDELCIFLGHKEDAIVLRQKPDKDFISYLKNLCVEIPHIYSITSPKENLTTSEMILSDEILLNELISYVKENSKSQINTYLFPYGITDVEEELSRSVSAKLVSTSKASKFFNDKLTLIELRSKYKIASPKYVVCTGKLELTNKGSIFVEKYGCVVLKERFESGGSGMAIVNNIKQYNNLIENIHDSFGGMKKIIIEKWYPHYYSCNYQYIVNNDSVFRYAYSTQLIDSKGRIVGSEFDFTDERLLNKINTQYIISRPLIEEFIQKGYRGVVGFDSLVCPNNQVFPIIDINCRVNLSSIFYEVIQKYFPCKYALFFYKEYSLKKCISFTIVLDHLGHYAFSPSKKEGAVILNFASLNVNLVTENGGIGRIFYAVIADCKSRAMQIYKEVYNKTL